jgi:hypothetical protein
MHEVPIEFAKGYTKGSDQVKRTCGRIRTLKTADEDLRGRIRYYGTHHPGGGIQAVVRVQREN